jgi:hypothetical protein
MIDVFQDKMEKTPVFVLLLGPSFNYFILQF